MPDLARYVVRGVLAPQNEQPVFSIGGVMRVLGFDTETTGLDTNKDVIIEMGAVLFDVDLENGEWIPGTHFCSLVSEPEYPALSEEIMKITGIKSLNGAMPFAEAVDRLSAMILISDMVVAHNKNFDKNILQSQLERYQLGTHIVTQKPWICSAEDLHSNREYKCWKLSHLALDRGVAVDPKNLHRAEDDVRLMGQMLTAAKANPVEMLKYANTPDVVIQAHIAAPWTDNGIGKAQAQALGYSWEKPKGSDRLFSKAWVKKVKENEVEVEAKKAPFATTIIGRI